MRAVLLLPGRSALGRLLLVAGLTLASASRLAAQECLRPSGTKANWAALGSGLAEGSHKAVTLEIGRNFLPDLAVFAETDALIWNGGGEPLPTRRSFRFTGAYRVHAATRENDTMLDALALCVTAAPEHVRVGDLKILHLPVGLVVSSEWQSASGKWRIVPHVEPRFGYRRAVVEGFSQSSAAISLQLGATAALDRYFGGLQFQRPLTTGDAWTARLRVGLEF
jgi:hypothetical protein